MNVMVTVEYERNRIMYNPKKHKDRPPTKRELCIMKEHKNISRKDLLECLQYDIDMEILNKREKIW